MHHIQYPKRMLTKRHRKYSVFGVFFVFLTTIYSKTERSTIKENDIGFNMIDKKTMSRVKYKKTCADCESREVKQDDIVKGFEYEDGKYVIFEEKDFEKLKSSEWHFVGNSRIFLAAFVC